MSTNPNGSQAIRQIKKKEISYHYHCSFALLLVRREMSSYILVSHKTLMIERAKEKWQGEPVCVCLSRKGNGGHHSAASNTN